MVQDLYDKKSVSKSEENNPSWRPENIEGECDGNTEDNAGDDNNEPSTNNHNPVGEGQSETRRLEINTTDKNKFSKEALKHCQINRAKGQEFVGYHKRKG